MRLVQPTPFSEVAPGSIGFDELAPIIDSGVISALVGRAGIGEFYSSIAVSDHIDVPAATSIANIFHSGGSASIKFRLRDITTAHVLLDKVSGSSGWYLNYLVDGSIQFLHYYATAWDRFTTATGLFTAGDVNDVNVDYTAVVGNTPVLKINGELVSWLTSDFNGVGAPLDDSSNVLALGNRSGFFTSSGLIDIFAPIRLNNVIYTSTQLRDMNAGGPIPLDSISAISEAVTNGNFETDLTGWFDSGADSFTRNTTSPISGIADANLTWTSTNSAVSFNIGSVKKGLRYDYSFTSRETGGGAGTTNARFYVRQAAGFGAANIGILEGNAIVNVQGEATNTAHAGFIVPDADYSECWVTLEVKSVIIDLYFDDVKFWRDGNVLNLDSFGYLQALDSGNKETVGTITGLVLNGQAYVKEELSRYTGVTADTSYPVIAGYAHVATLAKNNGVGALDLLVGLSAGTGEIGTVNIAAGEWGIVEKLYIFDTLDNIHLSDGAAAWASNDATIITILKKVGY